MLGKLAICFALVAAPALGHEMTPAYPDPKPSHLANVAKVSMSLFNARTDANYYQIDVFDEFWEHIPFASTYRIMKLDYKEREDFDVFIRRPDLERAVYLCTTSKVIGSEGAKAVVASRICSRLDGGLP